MMFLLIVDQAGRRIEVREGVGHRAGQRAIGALQDRSRCAAGSILARRSGPGVMRLKPAIGDR